MGAHRRPFALSLALAGFCATCIFGLDESSVVAVMDWTPHPDCQSHCDASNVCVSKFSSTVWGNCPQGSGELARQVVIDEQACWISRECTTSRTCNARPGFNRHFGAETTAPLQLVGCIRADCWNWPLKFAMAPGEHSQDSCPPGVRTYLHCCEQRTRLTCAPLLPCMPPAAAVTAVAAAAAGGGGAGEAQPEQDAAAASSSGTAADAATGNSEETGTVNGGAQVARGSRTSEERKVIRSTGAGSSSASAGAGDRAGGSSAKERHGSRRGGSSQKAKAEAAGAAMRRAVSRLLGTTATATATASATYTTAAGAKPTGSSSSSPAAAACRIPGSAGSFLRTNLSADPVWRAGLALLPPLGAALQAMPAVAAWYAQRWDAAARPMLAAVLCGADATDPASLPPDAAIRASAAARLLLAPALVRFLAATPTGGALVDQLAAAAGVSLDASTINTYLKPGYMVSYAVQVQALLQSDPLVLATGLAGGLMGGGDDSDEEGSSTGGSSSGGDGDDVDAFWAGVRSSGAGSGDDSSSGSSSGSSGSGSDGDDVDAFWAGVRGSGAGNGNGDDSSSGSSSGSSSSGDDEEDEDPDSIASQLDDLLDKVGLDDDMFGFDDDPDAGDGASPAPAPAPSGSGVGSDFDDGVQRYGSGSGMVPVLGQLVSVLTAGGPLGSSIGGLDLGAYDIFDFATNTGPTLLPVLLGGVAGGMGLELAAPDSRLTAAQVVADVLGLGSGLLRAALNTSAAAAVTDAPEFARALMAMSASERAAFTAMATSLDALTAAVVDLMKAVGTYPAPPPPRPTPLALPAAPPLTPSAPLPAPTRMPALPPALAAAAGTCASPAAALSSDLLATLTSPLATSKLFGVLTAAVAPAAGGALRALPGVLGWWTARWDASMQPVLAIAVCSPPGTPVPLPVAERALGFLRWLGLPLLRRAAATNTGAVVVDLMGGPQALNVSALDAYLTRPHLRDAVEALQRTAADGALGSLPAATLPLVALLGALLMPPGLAATDPRFTSSDMTLDTMVLLQAMAELPLRAAAAGWVAPQPAAPRATGAVSPGAGAGTGAPARDPFYDTLLTLTPSQTANFKAFSASMASLQSSVVKLMATSGGRPGPLLLSALPRAAFPLGPAPPVTTTTAATATAGRGGSSSSSGGGGLSGGAIAGIVIGVLAAVVIIAAVAVHIRKKQQQSKYNQLNLGGQLGAAAGGGGGAGGKLGSAGPSQEFDYESGFGRAIGKKVVTASAAGDEADDERAALAPGEKSSGL